MLINKIKKNYFFFSLPLLILCNIFLVKCHHQNNYYEKEKQNNIVNVEQINNELLKYNTLVNYDEKYQKQLTNCQTLINEIKQIINETNNNQYQSLITKIKHKQQWLTNNHLGFGYWLISIIQTTTSILTLIQYYNNYYNYYAKYKNYYDGNHNVNTKKIIALLKLIAHKIYDKTQLIGEHLLKKIAFKGIYLLLFIYFLSTFLFNRLNNTKDYLINNIHYLFTKYSFNKNYSLPKHQACYFYYDHSTKTIINNEKYFTIPFLFTNNHHLITNIFSLITNLLNLIIIIWSIVKYFIGRFSLWKLVRILFLTLILIELFSLINTFFIHIKGENNHLNQLRLMIISFFKSLPVINKFYYVPKNNYFKQKLSPLFFKYLISIFSIIGLLFINWFIDLIICYKKHSINSTFWFKANN